MSALAHARGSFEDFSGFLNEDLFEKSYGFVQEMQSRCVSVMRGRLSRRRDVALL